MAAIISVLLYVLGIIFFSFILWQKLREDYHTEEVFRLTLGVVIGLFVGKLAGDRLLPEYSFWISLGVAFLLGGVILRLQRLKFFEVIDAFALSWFWFLFFTGLSAVLQEVGRWSLAAVNYLLVGQIVSALVLIALYSYLKKRYRRFSWYPSGKIGFVGLSTLALYFLSLVVLHFAARPFKIAVVDGIIGAVASLLLIGVLYKRSGK